MALRRWMAAAVSASLTFALYAPVQAAQATPDWTGIWTRVGSLNFDPNIPGDQSDEPPYTPPYAERWKKIRAAEAAGQAINDASAQCAPPGLVRMMNMVYPMEILQTPGQVTIIPEWLGQVRRIFTDGRPHPADPDPSYNGHSVGRWEGDTLVVDTVGLKGNGILNDHGAPLGGNLHVTERWRLADPETLRVEITLEDPAVFTRPYSTVKTFKRRKDVQMMEYACEENNRNPVDANGVTGVILQGN